MKLPAIAACAALILVAAVFVRSNPAPQSPSALPDEVVANAVIAHKRLLTLYKAVQIYLNDNDEQLDDPIHLLELGYLTPQDFWHPGDNDTEPTVIDNSQPNAPNSAQVSFMFQTGSLASLQADQAIIWDASPTNNSGIFVSYVTPGGAVYTIPHVELPFPSNMSIARSQLKGIGNAMVTYGSDNFEYLPPTLLHLYQSGEVPLPRMFWNPGDSDPMPTDITNTVPNGINSANISLDYPAAGLTWNDVTPEMILVQDNTPANNLGLGVFAIMGDSSARFIPTGTFGDSNNDGSIDLADWAFLQCCYTGYNHSYDEIENDYCRLHDFDTNAHVDEEDNAAFLQAMTGPGQP